MVGGGDDGAFVCKAIQNAVSNVDDKRQLFDDKVV